MSREHRMLRGAMAGMLGGLFASWIMNEFMSSAGAKLQRAVQSDEQNFAEQVQKLTTANEPQEDTTMKAADMIVKEVTGGRHLTWREKGQAGPMVHYAFGAVVGGIYGGLAEYAPGITTGSGAGFGAVLFAGADLLAVPALGLSGNPAQQPASKLATPFVAHLVYGVATDMMRRLLR